MNSYEVSVFSNLAVVVDVPGAFWEFIIGKRSYAESAITAVDGTAAVATPVAYVRPGQDTEIVNGDRAFDRVFIREVDIDF